LIPDRLDLVHRAALCKLDTVGPFRSARLSGTSSSFADEAEAAMIERRADLLEAALDALRVGRGRPVAYPDIEDLITSRFEAETQALIDTHGRDPSAFIDALGGVPSFRKKALEKVRERLLECGILDERPRLNGTEILQHA